MSLARYKISEKDFPQAIKYLKHEKGVLKKDTANWVTKNEQMLQVIDGKVLFNNLPIVPREQVQSHLRQILFNKNSKTPKQFQ